MPISMQFNQIGIFLGLESEKKAVIFIFRWTLTIEAINENLVNWNPTYNSLFISLECRFHWLTLVHIGFLHILLVITGFLNIEGNTTNYSAKSSSFDIYKIVVSFAIVALSSYL